MKKVFLLLSLLFLLSACASSKTQDTSSTVISTEISVDETSSEENAEITSLTALIGKDKDIAGDNSCLTVIPYSITGDQYLIIIGRGADVNNELWCLNFDGTQITEKKIIEGIYGQFINYKSVETSQGSFIEISTASRMGSGDTYLLNTKTLKVDFTFYFTVDFNHEGYVNEEVVKQFELPTLPDSESGYNYSFVYNGKCLSSSYSDINGDGMTDVTFYGIKELSADNENYDSVPLQLIYVENVYLYDSATNAFILNEEKSSTKTLK